LIEFALTPEQEILRESTARLADEVYAAKAEAWDRDRTFMPDEERRRLGDLGLLGIGLPGAYGGGDGTLLDSLIVIEELAKRNQIAAFQAFESNTGPARAIAMLGSDAQKERFLPPVIRGSATMAISISEPDAGSAATDMTTSAVRDGDEVVINGAKRWCSGGGHAEMYLVYTRMNEQLGSKGIGAVVVEAGTGGLTFGPQEDLMGFRGIPSADMFFEDVRVPAENVIVPAGGFRDLFTAFSIERLGNATMSLAIGQACLDLTAKYVEERRQFGKDIVEFQSVQLALADMVLKTQAARRLIWTAAARAGTGAPDPLDASIAKCYSNEMAKEVSDLAIQLHGGNGYSVEYGLERYHRDAHGWALAGGTPTIQRIRIVSQYLGRSFNQRA
jgi:butyryl-CoA dehydrogenase